MGVAGLWDVIRPAGKTRSLTELSVTEGFGANPDGVRGFRIGIDASIWFFHAEYGREGENPVLRTLFFRCATLMRSPFLPLFVFDGPKRPDWKRGKKINKTSSKLIPGMKAIVESFGFEWRMAPGEAEAELAYLNRAGIIDGILSDDVDNFLFGAITVIRNPSNNLSGNRTNPVFNANGKDDKNHTKVYRMSEITAHPDVRLTHGGMILIGLMSGGDYQKGGLNRCGTVTAHGLAKCGFGDTLIQAAKTMTREKLEVFLDTWRHELCHELRTNSKGHIGRKQVALANSISAEFPDIDVLLSYTDPITSESLGRTDSNLQLTWAKEPDLGKLAATCEFYFEWGYKEAIIKRFRTVIWHSAVLRILRRAVLNMDMRTQPETASTSPPMTPRKPGKVARQIPGTPSRMIVKHFSTMKLDDQPDSGDDMGDEPLITKIHSERRHASTDGILEYRLEIAPAQLVRLAESGIKGTRSPEAQDEWADEGDEDEDHNKKALPEPESHMRVWMPACMVRLVEPRLVETFEVEQRRKRDKKLDKEGRVIGKVNKALNAQDKLEHALDDLPSTKYLQPRKARAPRQNPPWGDLGQASLTFKMQKFSATRDLTRKTANNLIGGDLSVNTDNSEATAALSVPREMVGNADGDGSDEAFVDHTLVPPTKPNPLTSWSTTYTTTYISVSDSDDGTTGGPSWATHVPFQDDSHLYDSDNSIDKSPHSNGSLPSISEQNHKYPISSSDPHQHLVVKSPPKLLKPIMIHKSQMKKHIPLPSVEMAVLPTNNTRSDPQSTVIEISDSEQESPPCSPDAPPIRVEKRVRISSVKHAVPTENIKRDTDEGRPQDIIDLT